MNKQTNKKNTIIFNSKNSLYETKQILIHNPGFIVHNASGQTV